jgi:hypothetical protein
MAVARFYFALNHGRSDDRYFLSTVPAPRKRIYQLEKLGPGGVPTWEKN